MDISLSTYTQVYSAPSIEKDLKELIQTMSTWPEWKIESLQKNNRNVLSSQIICQEIIITRKK